MSPKEPPFEVVKVISGNRITIPNSVRRDLGVALGDTLAFVRTPEGWILVRPEIRLPRVRRG